MKRILITQSNYIPWKGYFDAINMVDEIVLYDDVQFTKRDWRNRNVIKTAQGPLWLTIPVQVKGKFHQTIRETVISERGWNERHLRTVLNAFAKAPHFLEFKDVLAALYQGADMDHLSDINLHFLKGLMEYMGIKTPVRFSDGLAVEEKNPTRRLIMICKACGADEYFSGPAAKAYLEEHQFLDQNIKLTYLDYTGYPEYPQLYPPFTHTVSMLDLIVNTGPKFRQFMKSKFE